MSSDTYHLPIFPSLIIPYFGLFLFYLDLKYIYPNAKIYNFNNEVQKSLSVREKIKF